MEEHQISGIGELLEVLPSIYKGKGSKPRKVWFRGHANHSWHLEPSLARSGKLVAELQLMKQFKQNAFQFLDVPPQDEHEWIFLMQHYAIPTRLLDWTENPLIGLYFAVQDFPGSKKPPAALWCLYPQELNKSLVLFLHLKMIFQPLGMRRSLRTICLLRLGLEIQKRIHSLLRQLDVSIEFMHKRGFLQSNIEKLFELKSFKTTKIGSLTL
ncbi:MAG: FRG domain-containing protein [Terracidiphilus sp.]|jgi:hypothetical protein